MPKISIALACLALTLACAPSRTAESTNAATEADSLRADPLLAGLGETPFKRHCASCHGMDARGSGPVARSLQTPPANLRRIAQRRGGTFPSAEIARKIDGRFEVEAHGTREMPVWGRVFGADIPETDTAESIARGQVSVLVEYLKSIQDPADAAAHTEQIRQTMGGIFGAMRVLLPLSLTETGFEDPEQAANVRAAIELLDRSSAQLEQHGASGDVGFAHLARSLAIDARDLRLRYDAGHSREAGYVVQDMADTCVACHSRLPATNAPRSEAFAADIAVADLRIEQRAKLFYATRQFDAALDEYEAMLATRSVSANDSDLGGHIDDYLELAIRVRRVPERANAALADFATRKDLSPVLKEEIASWRAALTKLASTPPSKDPVASARALVAKPARSDRHSLVEHLEASGLLHRALDGKLASDQRAEAYYLLGLIETRIGRSYWLSQAEAYLETAIRLAPGEEIASDAYDKLEQFLVAGYTGSSGTHVPPDIEAKLDQLRRIADATPAAKL
jgi:mono/diheme cytochrome c family protein